MDDKSLKQHEEILKKALETGTAPVMDDAFYQTHTAYIKHLQENLNSYATYQSDTSYLNVLNSEKINATGQFDPEALDYIARYIDKVDSDSEINTIRAKAREGAGIYHSGWTAKEQGKTRAATYEPHIKEMQETVERLKTAIEFEKFNHSNETLDPVLQLKFFLRDNGYMSLSKSNATFIDETGTATLVPEISTSADDPGLGLGLVNFRTQIKTLLNNAQLRAITGMDFMPQTGEHTPEMMIAMERTLEAFPEEGRAELPESLQSVLLNIDTFYKSYAQLTPEHITRANEALHKGFRHWANIGADGAKYDIANEDGKADLNENVKPVAQEGTTWSAAELGSVKELLNYTEDVQDPKAIREDFDEVQPDLWDGIFSNKSVDIPQRDIDYFAQNAAIYSSFAKHLLREIPLREEAKAKQDLIDKENKDLGLSPENIQAMSDIKTLFLTRGPLLFPGDPDLITSYASNLTAGDAANDLTFSTLFHSAVLIAQRRLGLPENGHADEATIKAIRDEASSETTRSIIETNYKILQTNTTITPDQRIKILGRIHQFEFMMHFAKLSDKQIAFIQNKPLAILGEKLSKAPDIKIKGLHTVENIAPAYAKLILDAQKAIQDNPQIFEDYYAKGSTNEAERLTEDYAKNNKIPYARVPERLEEFFGKPSSQTQPHERRNALKSFPQTGMLDQNTIEFYALISDMNKAGVLPPNSPLLKYTETIAAIKDIPAALLPDQMAELAIGQILYHADSKQLETPVAEMRVWLDIHRERINENLPKEHQIPNQKFIDVSTPDQYGVLRDSVFLKALPSAFAFAQRINDTAILNDLNKSMPALSRAMPVIEPLIKLAQMGISTEELQTLSSRKILEQTPVINFKHALHNVANNKTLFPSGTHYSAKAQLFSSTDADTTAFFAMIGKEAKNWATQNDSIFKSLKLTPEELAARVQKRIEGAKLEDSEIHNIKAVGHLKKLQYLSDKTAHLSEEDYKTIEEALPKDTYTITKEGFLRFDVKKMQDALKDPQALKTLHEKTTQLVSDKIKSVNNSSFTSRMTLIDIQNLDPKLGLIKPAEGQLLEMSITGKAPEGTNSYRLYSAELNNPDLEKGKVKLPEGIEEENRDEYLNTTHQTMLHIIALENSYISLPDYHKPIGPKDAEATAKQKAVQPQSPPVSAPTIKEAAQLSQTDVMALSFTNGGAVRMDFSAKGKTEVLTLAPGEALKFLKDLNKPVTITLLQEEGKESTPVSKKWLTQLKKQTNLEPSTTKIVQPEPKPSATQKVKSNTKTKETTPPKDPIIEAMKGRDAPELFVSRLEDLQSSFGLPITGKYDDATRNALSNHIQRLYKEHLNNYGSIIETKNGKSFKLKDDGEIYELDKNGKLSKNPIANIKDNYPPHIIAFKLMERALDEDNTIETLQQKKLTKLRIKQRDLIVDKMGLDKNTAQQLQRNIEASPNKTKAKGLITKALEESGNELNGELNIFLTEIWNTQRTLNSYKINPNTEEITMYDGLFRAFRQRAAIHDVTSFLSGAGLIDSLEALKAPTPDNLPLIDDRFFDLDVYDALDTSVLPYKVWQDVEKTGYVNVNRIRPEILDDFLLRHPELKDAKTLNLSQITEIEDARVEASLIDKADLSAYLKEHPELKDIKYLTTQEVAEIADMKLVSLAEELGVKEDGITQAIYDGKLRPYHHDFRLAYAGTADPSYEDIIERYGDNFFDHLIEQGIVKPGEMPHHAYLQAVYADFRDEAWNAKRGSMHDIKEPIRMMVNGRDTLMDGQDIALRQLMRTNVRRFEETYGIDRSPALRFDDAIKILESKEDTKYLADELREEVKSIMDNESVFGYFNLGSLHKASPFNLRGDYEDGRNSEFIPILQKRLHQDTNYILKRNQLDENTSPHIAPTPQNLDKKAQPNAVYGVDKPLDEKITVSVSPVDQSQIQLAFLDKSIVSIDFLKEHGHNKDDWENKVHLSPAHAKKWLQSLADDGKLSSDELNTLFEKIDTLSEAFNMKEPVASTNLETPKDALAALEKVNKSLETTVLTAINEGTLDVVEEEKNALAIELKQKKQRLNEIAEEHPTFTDKINGVTIKVELGTIALNFSKGDHTFIFENAQEAKDYLANNAKEFGFDLERLEEIEQRINELLMEEQTYKADDKQAYNTGGNGNCNDIDSTGYLKMKAFKDDAATMCGANIAHIAEAQQSPIPRQDLSTGMNS